jgi:uridine kinase
MPCYQQRTTTLEVAAADLDIMAKALEALSMTTHLDAATRTIRVSTREGQSGYFANGRLVISGVVGLDENALRREYSKQSIVVTARKQGWQLRFKADGDIEAVRRRFA